MPEPHKPEIVNPGLTPEAASIRAAPVRGP